MESSDPENHDVDVVVVGAGVSGLAAARALHRAGLDVRVNDSRDRIGGRLRSVRSAAGHPIDLGATWFWPGERRVAALVEELGLATHPQHLAGDAVYHDPSGRARLSGNPIDVPSGRFSDGATALTDALARDLPAGSIHLGDPVTAVAAVPAMTAAGGDGRALTVTTGRGRVSADHVVLGLAPALAVERIRFDPALPDRLIGLAAATPVWMASSAKVVALYAEPFWREAGLAGSAMSHLGPLGEIHDMSGPGGDPAALFGFVRFRSATDPMPERSAILDQLALLFGPDAAAPEELLVVDWRQEPDTAPANGPASPAYQLFGHRLYDDPAMEGRLHWASTETTTSSPGHIESALAGAERAVAAILSSAASPRPAPTVAPATVATNQRSDR